MRLINPSQKKTRHTQGILLLIATTLIWGTTFPLVKDAISSMTPATLVGIRFAIAAVVFVPLVRRLSARLLLDGTLLGFLLFSSFATQVIGLETISANRAAFITSLNVILVPLLEPLLGRRVPRVIFLASALALTGIGMMSWEGGALTIGDLWIFGCALSYAVYILLLEAVASRHSSMSLTAVQLVVSAVLGLSWAAPELEQFGALSTNFGTVLYLGLIATAAVTWTQTIAQRWVTASEAALIYALEPVFAGIFSFWLLSETFGTRGLLGAALVVAATVLSQSQR